MKYLFLIFALVIFPIEVMGKIVKQVNQDGTITYTNVHEEPVKIAEKEDPNVGDIIDDIKVYSVSTKLIKKSKRYAYVGIKVKVKNLSDEQDVSVQIECLDKDGFQLDDTYVDGIVRPGTIGYLTGQAMIEKSMYPKVKEWRAK